MAKIASIENLRRRAREFRAANGANVTLTFALATIPMVGFVGAAVDYSRANSVKAAMQAAADSTALMLSKTADPVRDSDQGQRILQGAVQQARSEPIAPTAAANSSWSTPPAT